ncbi:Vacuolar protein sorting-associated protein 20 [Coemansia sp. RSA 552]|nr:Vacuolar protein sorting-associated protein 20 [Coemansia sp. RSA 552]
MGAGQSRNKVTAQDKAILDMKVQRDKLKQYQKRVQVVLDREDALARQLLRQGDKKRALLALRRRKYQEQMVRTTDEQLFNLQQLVETIEFSLVQKDVIFGLEQGSRVLKQLNSEVRLEDVERLAEDTAEAVAYQEEISEILRTNMSAEDEEKVLAELEELERQESTKEQLGMPHAPRHPLPEQQLPPVVTSEDGALLSDGEPEGEEEQSHRKEPLLA